MQLPLRNGLRKRVMDRNEEIVAAYSRGGAETSFRSVGARFGISGERVRQIVSRWERDHGVSLPRSAERQRAAKPKPAAPPLPLSLAQRLLALAHLTDGGCWQWDGRVSPDGYPTGFRAPDGGQYPYRASYALWRGPIPAGWCIVTECANRRCINPFHLRAVSRRQAIRLHPDWDREADRWARKQVRPPRTHCMRGHPLTPENTRWNSSAVVMGDGRRVKIRTRLCAICSRARVRRYLERRTSSTPSP